METLLTFITYVAAFLIAACLYALLRIHLDDYGRGMTVVLMIVAVLWILARLTT